MSLIDGQYDLLETMAFDPHEGIRLLDLHLARMKASADVLGFAFDRHDVRNELQAATFRLRERSRVRLLVSRGGALAIEVRDHRTWPHAIVPVAVVPRQASANDPRLRHKTTDRAVYRDALRRGGTYEVLLTDEKGYLTEGCFSTLFVERGDKLVTPPLTRGLLPGVLRQSLIDMGEAAEADLKVHDLERGFFIGNAARGMVAATLAR
ncbi:MULTISPECIES: aminotransferase class IV [Sphingobium]|jgi:4-amino-4-deoxychorismate lyase|uniref:aminotransferase class IV n=1 Tax=Sphingobium TaxID=165695 RepID=UPI000C6B2CDA|nr:MULTISPECIES: aminotransferase class IV [Sphingobium]MBS49315.1 aminotransferase [Sphingobium sp.]MCC4257294.1 aminotransferase class IV [Sphingobium lactosutens]MEC9018502.1 aminotransferase class IV [Pseudomonadota bacterium]MEE2741646.1 aminotransferase class IV [Pseudomonadota bacterium]|tara:strand:- start:1093 stop:1716 length:624 start_codon:yes stop_codon:yes gene_type:complete